ncbi:hypothetical protein EVA_12595 [gut metagenome]|uniref:Uncharacterized protein n=1 Tax=gut metagenome TaxID=749906 RepID=J9FWB7_9ZZZZ
MLCENVIPFRIYSTMWHIGIRRERIFLSLLMESS